MIRIGWASREFTPQRPALVQGQMYIRIARDAKDALTLTALAMEDDTSGDQAIWISCDLTNTPDVLQDAVRERLASRLPDVAGEKVLLSATHTHDGPVVLEGAYPHPGGDVMTPAECRDWVADRAAEAAVAAWESREPAQVARAFGHAVVGHNRRAVYADGTAQMYGKTDRPDFRCIEGCEDHSLDILAFSSANGELTGLVLDIPCPSQVEEHLTQWSADYWHDVREELRTRLGEGLHVLSLCGAAGDQSPHFLLYAAQEEEMRERRGVTERREIAQRVADAVERALPCAIPTAGEAVVAHSVRPLSLPGRHITAAEADWAREQLEQWISRGQDQQLWWPRGLARVIECFEHGRALPETPVELHVLRVGDAVIATNPFELYLDYGLRIKARSPAAQTLVAQLAAGRGSYLPSERAVQGGHYGAHPVVAPVGPEGGQRLVEETLASIREVWERPS